MVRLSAFKLARMRVELRQIHVARLLGVSENLIVQWETGRRKPGAHHRQKLAEILGVAPEELFPEVPDHETPRQCGTSPSPR